MKTDRSRMRGFTLVEVMIALSLLSLIMLGLIGALRTFGQTADTLDRRVEVGEDVRLLGDFLRATLVHASAQPRWQNERGAGVPFVGDAAELIWLGSMPARHGLGGMHHLRLVQSGGDLFLQYLSHPGTTDLPDWNGAPAHRLAENVDALQIAYQTRPQRPDEEPQWQTVWDDTEHLPARVRIDIQANGKIWPPFIIALNSGAGAAMRSGIVAGPVYE